MWTVLGAVEQMDLEPFRGGVSAGRCGSAPYDPAMMVALLLYAYARGNRSSRGIERACWEDVAYKVITGMRTPDHSTIAEFRRRHETEIAELFDDVLGLCREAGLVSVGVITIDGTKIKANASMDQNRSYRELVTEILREAEEIDRREDELYGEQRGDELPEQLRTPEGRRQALAGGEAADRGAQGPRDQRGARPSAERGGGSGVGARSWWASWWAARVASGRAPRAGRAAGSAQAQPIPRDREDRLFQALGRLGGEPPGRPGRQRGLRALAGDGAGHARPGAEGQQQAVRGAGAAGGDDQSLRSGLAG